MTETTDVVIAGLSGQGVIMTGRILASAFVDTDYHVRTYDVLGTAHRGTLIFGQVRISKSPHFANLVPPGTADVLVAFEPLEGMRVGSYYLSNGGIAILNTHRLIPIYLTIGRDHFSDVPRPLGYPSLEFIADFFKDMQVEVVFLDATELAKQAGHFNTANIVLLGAIAATGKIPIETEKIKKSMEQFVPSGTVELNIRACDLGIQAYQQEMGKRKTAEAKKV